MRILNRIAGEPWAITETALHTILEIAARENESQQAVAAKLGRNLQNTYSVTERDGVAIIPVTGPLFRYAMGRISRSTAPANAGQISGI